jgi:hypothetical protein
VPSCSFSPPPHSFQTSPVRYRRSTSYSTLGERLEPKTILSHPPNSIIFIFTTAAISSNQPRAIHMAFSTPKAYSICIEPLEYETATPESTAATTSPPSSDCPTYFITISSHHAIFNIPGRALEHNTAGLSCPAAVTSPLAAQLQPRFKPAALYHSRGAFDFARTDVHFSRIHEHYTPLCCPALFA